MGISQIPQAIVPAAFTSGGMTTLTTMTLSGSSVTSSTFSSTGYKQLMIYLKGVYGTVADDLFMRINADTGNNYCFHGFRGAGGGTQYARNGNTNYLQVGLVSDSTASTKQKTTGLIYITNPADTDVVNMNHQISAFDGTNMYATAGSGSYDSSAAITSITFFTASGTFSGGTTEIIGLK